MVTFSPQHQTLELTPKFQRLNKRRNPDSSAEPALRINQRRLIGLSLRRSSEHTWGTLSLGVPGFGIQRFTDVACGDLGILGLHNVCRERRKNLPPGGARDAVLAQDFCTGAAALLHIQDHLQAACVEVL